MPPPTGVEAARLLLEQALDRRVFPCAVARVGSSAAPIWQHAIGDLWFDAPGQKAPRATLDTWFDLASLTKPLTTTPVVLELAATRRIDLADPIVQWLPEWRGPGRDGTTFTDLLEHASGLPARLTAAPSCPAAHDLASRPEAQRAYLRAICESPLEHPRRARSIYSDLGFMLLGALAERVAGATLNMLAAQLCEGLLAMQPSAGELRYIVPPDALARTAPTEALAADPRAGQRLCGEVHDDYAAALAGIAGHAGLFGTAAGVAAIASTVLSAARGRSAHAGAFSVEWTERAVRGSTVSGSSRALGWDRMLPTSSCGTRMSSAAFGHVGFTGTSLWIDPTRDRYYVLLTNRACGGGTLDDIKAVRRAFHDALADV